MKRCEMNDLPGLLDFYRLVIRDTAEIAVHARWEFGKHPTETAISDYVGRGMMYITEKDAGIIAAVAVTPFQPEDYHGVEWQADLADDEVAAVHILAVNPRSQGRGYAKQMMRDVIDLSKGMGKKAVRMDALACNAPAHRLYESLGFKKRGVCRWYAENTGWFDFYLFECLL